MHVALALLYSKLGQQRKEIPLPTGRARMPDKVSENAILEGKRKRNKRTKLKRKEKSIRRMQI